MLTDYAEKDVAKAEGARWDLSAKRWYAPRVEMAGLSRITAPTAPRWRDRIAAWCRVQHGRADGDSRRPLTKGRCERADRDGPHRRERAAVARRSRAVGLRR
ncbi:DUF5710 domain-containing protein [Rhodococcus qingshengii]|uniref:DUF5710 domain-containing protein n=1 Tax=Rhodococcus TaxID=1827 RepID=UPI0035B42DD0